MERIVYIDPNMAARICQWCISFVCALTGSCKPTLVRKLVRCISIWQCLCQWVLSFWILGCWSIVINLRIWAAEEVGGFSFWRGLLFHFLLGNKLVVIKAIFCHVKQRLKDDIAISWGSAKQFHMVFVLSICKSLDRHLDRLHHLWTLLYLQVWNMIYRGGDGVNEKAEYHILLHGFMVHSWYFQDVVSQQRGKGPSSQLVTSIKLSFL